MLINKLMKIILAMSLLGLSVFLITKKGDRKSLSLQAKNNLIITKILTTDEKTIQSPTATDFNLKKSITRLSFENSKILKKDLEKLATHKSLSVRAAAVEASGSFINSGELNFLINNLNSPEKEIRLAALRGLSRISEPNNILTINKYLKMNNISREEYLEANLTMIKITPSLDQLKLSTKNILDKLNLENIEDQLLFIKILPYTANDKRIIENARKLAELGRPISGTIKSIEFLATYDKDWLQLNSKNITKTNDPLVKMTITEALKK